MGKFAVGCLAVIGAAVVVLFLLALIFIRSSGNHEASIPTPRPEQAQNPSQQPIPDMTVSAMEIDADYAANEVAADRKYSGKVLRVFGIVDSIDKGPLGGVHIVFVGNANEMLGGGSPFGVDATMNPGNDDIAARLVKWQKVVMICKGVSREIGSVMLGDCEFDLSTAHRREDDPPLQSSY